MNKKILPPTYFQILLLFPIIIYFIFQNKKIIPFPYNLIGILFITFGIIINIITDNIFKKEKTTVKPHEKPSSLVISGPFKISRHPMYLGMASILIGASLILGTLISFIFPIIFIFIINKKFIPLEEKNLEKIFTQEYINYKNRVRKWI